MSITPPKTPSRHRRRANRSSEEEVYAGPTQSLPVETSLSPVSNPESPPTVLQRPLRADGVAESEKVFEEDGLMIGCDRVGTLPLPRLPVVFEVLSPSHHAYAFGKALRLEAFKVLDRNNVGIQGCQVGHRLWRFDPREEHPLPVTLVIWSKEIYHHLWRDVCLELRDFVAQASPMPIGIEIVDPKAEEVTRSFPLDRDDLIVRSWWRVQSSILSILHDTDASMMTAIRRGKAELPKENPETIFVSVPEDSETDWVVVRDSIVEVLDQNDLAGVAVEISRGTPSLYNSSGKRQLPDSIWGDRAIAGASIGPHASQELYSSTLGGFVQLQDSSDRWTTFGLTCFHAVIPPKPNKDLLLDEQVMRTWHRNGFSPADASRFNIPICQPSERDYRYQVDLWKSDIASDEARMSQIQGERVANHPWSEATYNSLELMVRDSQQKISAAERFFTDDHHYLGNVFAASGNRLTTQERTLDWALVALKPERIGANMFVPNDPAIARKYFGPGREKPVSEVAPPESSSRVFKIGRSSDWTMGSINGVEMFSWDDHDYNNEDGTPIRRVSHDHCVAGTMGSDCCMLGDSGAFVIDDEGKFIGLLFGGDPKGSVTRVLMAHDLFADIKKVTGVKGVRLAPV